MCECAYPQEIFIQFISRSNALFELINLAKMKDTTQNSLSAQLLEAPQQNFMKLCSYEGLNGRCAYPQEILIQFFGE